ncbi:DUF7126 family protein [Natronomonas sp. EA1]|uniref:DUF7126 family protein n=1 Tax=Natronomonas sp. EA1 TaxID=3421655 RepID=UPI003EB89560
MKALLVGPDTDGLMDALEKEGVEVVPVEGTGARPALEDAGVLEADILIITDVGLSTSIPVARDLKEDLRVLVYSRDSVPEFVRGKAATIVDPELIAADVVAEEVAASTN